MKKRRQGGLLLVGGSSLLTAFAILCMTTFALLALSTAQAERRLSDAAARAAMEYYEADLEAERMFARLRAGEEIPGVWEKNGIYSYECQISGHQTLLIEVCRNGNGWKVLRWQNVARYEADDETLPVWNGR